jgi:hypothetical protein
MIYTHLDEGERASKIESDGEQRDNFRERERERERERATAAGGETSTPARPALHCNRS